jgi:alginate O-acetyltransferase complex protein AlgI
MLFHTPIFFIFFSCFFLLYLATQRRLGLQNTLILAASYIFYGAWDYRFLVLIVVSTTTDFIAAIGAARQRASQKEIINSILFTAIISTLLLSYDLPNNYIYLVLVYGFLVAFYILVTYFFSLEAERSAKCFVAFSAISNLGLLGVFKYFNFFADSLVELAHVFDISLSRVSLDVVLPVGISFYTFQTVSYTIDSYRKQLNPSRNFIEVSAYVAFFPQLVAGPIERGASLLPQFSKPRTISLENIRSGGYLFLWGLFKKAVIADNLATLSDPVFASPSTFSTGELLVALLAFTFQIYCDFSGYSDMARGIGRAMGFNLMINFNIPYFSRTPSEFWQRWHISLSSWLRDYLYIPLGGNRKGPGKTYRNLFLTMLIGGLWHGASWTFVLWGATHGLILIAYRALGVRDQNNDAPLIQKGLQIALMFSLVTFTWLLFRAGDFATLKSYLAGIIAFTSMNASWLTLGLLVFPILLHDTLQELSKKQEYIYSLPFFARFNVVLIVLASFALLTPSGEQAFIYFDF